MVGITPVVIVGGSVVVSADVVFSESGVWSVVICVEDGVISESLTPHLSAKTVVYRSMNPRLSCTVSVWKSIFINWLVIFIFGCQSCS